jgi:RNA polymerase subunit RPABC4/transcription elongation factor Spt4
MKACPYCAEQIQDAAIKCRFCGSSLTDTAPSNDSVDADARALLAANRKIEAIRLVRERRRTDLKAAKEYVESLYASSDGRAVAPKKTCQSCKFLMPTDATRCPHCGQEQKSAAAGWVIFALAVVAVAIILASMVNG